MEKLSYIVLKIIIIFKLLSMAIAICPAINETVDVNLKEVNNSINNYSFVCNLIFESTSYLVGGT